MNFLANAAISAKVGNSAVFTISVFSTCQQTVHQDGRIATEIKVTRDPDF